VAAPIQRLVEKHKLDPKSLKKAFDSDTLEERPKVKKLVESIRDVIRDGINRNQRDYRLYKAMDWAYDSPFYQVSYTQLRGLMSGKPDDKKVLEVVNQWGLSHLLPDVTLDGKICCNPDGSHKKALNLPVFFNVFVPIVMAYITIRWAKLFNDRNLTPLYKYEPVQFTKENRFRCEVLTQIVQRQATQFDYKGDLRQSIFQSLLYGFCINFPREAWFVEKQETEEGKEKIVREGLRFNMPHPSRIYYDLYHRLSSLNSNSGCEYAGYWELCRYKDIYDNELYWNKEKISYGALSWFDIGVSDFLDHVFPCTMKFPTINNSQGVGGVGALDREGDAANTYGQGDFNAATLVTQHFQRIIPKDCGLGDYEHPVWFRFVYASDTTVIWAEPLAFDRLPVYAFDADFNRAKFRSLALEIMPFQDHVSNLLTQWILSVKENLVNPVFYDKEKIPAESLKQLENLGQKMYNGRMFVPFSSTENFRMKIDQREAFFIPQLTHHNTAEISNLITGVLSMLDRVLQLSPQEIGQAAQHEQTAEETRVIAQNTSTRVTFTGSFIDDGDYAKKVMIYDATMAHADDDIVVGITSSLAATEAEFKKLLSKVGFSIADGSSYDPHNPDSMHEVKGQKSTLKLESFSSTRDATERINNPAVADAMSKIFAAIAGNPVLIQAIGPFQLVELLNQIVVTMGLPQEFRLKSKEIDTTQPEAQQSEQVGGMLKEFAAQVQQQIAQSSQQTIQAAVQASGQQTQQIVGQASQEIMQAMAQQTEQEAQAIAQALQEQKAQIDQLGQAVNQLAQVVEAAQMGMAGVPPGLPGVPMEPEPAVF